LAVAADEDRRFLIAAGTQHYRHLGSELTAVPAELRKVVALFTEQGYAEQLTELRHDPTKAALETGLSGWLNDPTRQRTDIAVIYLSGHGDIDGVMFYLLTADTKEGQYAATAVSAAFLVWALGSSPRARRVLLILDTCYAGQGALHASEAAGRMAPWQNLTGPYEGIWVVAASRPKEEPAKASLPARSSKPPRTCSRPPVRCSATSAWTH
jgi:hypothetical protein